MVIRWLHQLGREWEISTFGAMLVLTTAGMVMALITLIPSTPDDSGWIAPTAKLRHIQIDYPSEFTPLGNYHAMRVQVPGHYRPHRGTPVHSTVRPPQLPLPPPIQPVSVPVPPPPEPIRQLIYNGFIVTPSNEVLAYFQQRTIQGKAIDSHSRYVANNEAIETYRVIGLTADHVTLVHGNGERLELPRATPFQIH